MARPTDWQRRVDLDSFSQQTNAVSVPFEMRDHLRQSSVGLNDPDGFDLSEESRRSMQDLELGALDINFHQPWRR